MANNLASTEVTLTNNSETTIITTTANKQILIGFTAANKTTTALTLTVKMNDGSSDFVICSSDWVVCAIFLRVFNYYHYLLHL